MTTVSGLRLSVLFVTDYSQLIRQYSQLVLGRVTCSQVDLHRTARHTSTPLRQKGEINTSQD